MSPSVNDVLAWIDLEMTGLDPSRHVIVEIASLVTDDDLHIVAEGPNLVLRTSEDELARMDEFVVGMHRRSGLLDALGHATVERGDAEAQTLEFLRQHIAEPGTVPLCGNSIGTDRRFLQEYMPTLESFFHYRNVDVSTVKELLRRWRPDVIAAVPDKASSHRALDDIRESVAELAFYRERAFRDVEAVPQ